MSTGWNVTENLFTLPPITSDHIGYILTNLTSTLMEAEQNNVTLASSMMNEAKLTAPAFDSQQWRYSAPWIVVLSLAYLVVFLLGLIGNASVLWVVFGLRRTSSHSMFANCNKVFNGLIANLALADLLVIIFCLPATLVGNILTRKYCIY